MLFVYKCNRATMIQNVNSFLSFLLLFIHCSIGKTWSSDVHWNFRFDLSSDSQRKTRRRRTHSTKETERERAQEKTSSCDMILYFGQRTKRETQQLSNKFGTAMCCTKWNLIVCCALTLQKKKIVFFSLKKQNNSIRLQVPKMRWRWILINVENIIIIIVVIIIPYYGGPNTEPTKVNSSEFIFFEFNLIRCGLLAFIWMK